MGGPNDNLNPPDFLESQKGPEDSMSSNELNDSKSTQQVWEEYEVLRKKQIESNEESGDPGVEDSGCHQVPPNQKIEQGSAADLDDKSKKNIFDYLNAFIGDRRKENLKENNS